MELKLFTNLINALGKVAGVLESIVNIWYDKRNSELYGDLIRWDRRIEEELGIDTGQFRNRISPTHALSNHSNATSLIYGTALIGLFFVLPMNPFFKNHLFKQQLSLIKLS